jgi:NAD(P)-dependent dehydrogenase (short-subunit alcohol dehydrogenase family)
MRRPATKTELHGWVVAITGGARGIGLATAKALARRGALVAIGDLDAGNALAAASAGKAGRSRDPPIRLNRQYSATKAARLKIVVSPVRVRVWPSAKGPPARAPSDIDARRATFM